MNRERLELAATLLDEVEAKTWEQPKLLLFFDQFEEREVASQLAPDSPKPKFNIRYWGSFTYGKGADGLVVPGTNPCGFSACAVGHMCIDPRFQALGLWADPFWSPLYVMTPEEAREEGYEEDERIELNDFEAVRRFFGITYEDARWLFTEGAYPYIVGQDVKASDVAARIRQLLQTEE